MNPLIEYIREGIENRGSRVVFENRLDPIFPIVGEDRQPQMKQVRALAAAQGWKVVFQHGGKMARFFARES